MGLQGPKPKRLGLNVEEEEWAGLGYRRIAFLLRVQEKRKKRTRSVRAGQSS